MGDNTTSLRIRNSVYESVRVYAENNDVTYSEAIEDLIPHPHEHPPVSFGESRWMSIDVETHAKLKALKGEGTTYNELLIWFMLQRDDWEVQQ